MSDPSTTVQELRLGVVGFGRLVRGYALPALRRLPGVQVVGVADPLAASRRAAAAAVPGIEPHADHTALLDHLRLDGIVVASPPSTHLEVWRDAAARGVPAFIEKPLLLADQLPLLPADASPRVMVDFNRRFWGTYRHVAALVRRGVLGSPLHLELSLHLDVEAWSRVSRHRFAASEGGLLHDLGSHALDLASMFFGEEPRWIACTTSSTRHEDDRARLELSFPSGATASCDLAYGKRTRERLVLRGPEGTARLWEPNAALRLEPSGVGAPRLSPLARDAALLAYRVARRSRSMARATIAAALASFADALRSGAAFSPGFADGVRNARWIAVAARSARRGGGPEAT